MSYQRNEAILILTLEQQNFIKEQYKKYTDEDLAKFTDSTSSQVAFYRQKNRLLKLPQRARGTTICWECANALCGCSWSKWFQPVIGWNAIATKIIVGDKADDSFVVLDCPEFKRG